MVPRVRRVNGDPQEALPLNHEIEYVGRPLLDTKAKSLVESTLGDWQKVRQIIVRAIPEPVGISKLVEEPSVPLGLSCHLAEAASEKKPNKAEWPALEGS